MKKHTWNMLLLLLLAVACLFAFAACGQPDAEPNQPDASEPQQPEQTQQPDAPEQEPGENGALPESAETVLREVNIYHFGVKTPLSPDDKTAARFAETVSDLRMQTILKSTLDTAEMRVTAEHAMQAAVAIEVIYDTDGATTWDMFVPLFDDGNRVWENVIYCGGILEGDDGSSRDNLPANSVAGEDFAQELNAYVLDNLEQAMFEGDMVDIAGVTAAYSADSTEIAEPLRSRLLYRALAFYQDVLNQNFLAMHSFTAGDLYETFHAAAMFSQFDEGGTMSMPGLEDIADQLSGKSLRSVTVSGSDGAYSVRLDIEVSDVLTIDFVLDEGGLPLVESFDFSLV